VADSEEDGVGGIASTTLEVAAAEVALGFHVADHGFDRGSTSQLALDDAEHASLLAGDEDAARVLRVVAAVALIDIAALDRAAGELWVSWMTSRRVCPSYGLPGGALACSTNWPPGARALAHPHVSAEGLSVAG